jgi:REP element-mobilizing transposase RayT
MITHKAFHQGELPHYTPNDAPYFVTFNLHGLYLRPYVGGKMKFAEYDRLLDHAAEGPHHLKDPRIAKVVYDKLIWLAGEVMTMHAFTVMSNHVHLMMKLHEQQPLSEVMQRVKGATSRECNMILETSGTFWQRERYDRVLRRYEHMPTLRYIVYNPVKAGIVKHWRDHPWTWLNEELYPNFDAEEAERLGTVPM